MGEDSCLSNLSLDSNAMPCECLFQNVNFRLYFSVYNKEEGDGDHKTSQTDHSGAIKGNSETTEKSAQATKEQSEQHQQTDTKGQVNLLATRQRIILSDILIQGCQ